MITINKKRLFRLVGAAAYFYYVNRVEVNIIRILYNSIHGYQVYYHSEYHLMFSVTFGRIPFLSGRLKSTLRLGN